MKNVFFICILMVLNTACKGEADESKTTPNEITNQIEAPVKELLVVMNFKTNKADTFKLMLNNIEIDEFQKKNIHILEDVSPTSTSDVISVNFGANNISEQLHISLGNKVEKTVSIESINMSYGKNTLSINASELSEFFFFNKFISQNETTSEIKTQKVDGKHSPLMFMKKKALIELTK